MADKLISELNSVSSINSTDKFVVETDEETVRVNFGTIAKATINNLSVTTNDTVATTDTVVVKPTSGDPKRVALSDMAETIVDEAIDNLSSSSTVLTTDKLIVKPVSGNKKLVEVPNLIKSGIVNFTTESTISDEDAFVFRTTGGNAKVINFEDLPSPIVNAGIDGLDSNNVLTTTDSFVVQPTTGDPKKITVANASKTITESGINNLDDFDSATDSAIKSTDEIVVSTEDGIKKVPFRNITVISGGSAATSPNCIFRGENLGAVTSENIGDFITEYGISSGVFTDIYPGDYFTASYNGTETVFRVAGMNSFLYTGDKDPNTNSTNGLASNHIVVVPDYQLQTAAMNSSDSTTGGYLGSNMFKSVIGGSGVTSGINKNLYTIFGSHLIKYRELLSNAINTSSKCTGYEGFSGASSGWEWTDVYANLLSGVHLWGCSPAASSLYDFGIVTGQLPLFRFEPKYIINRKSSDGTRNWYWLRNVVSSSYFAGCSYNGSTINRGASDTTGGVRPLFLLG